MGLCVARFEFGSSLLRLSCDRTLMSFIASQSVSLHQKGIKISTIKSF